jgi:hypothetical protein
MKKVNLKNSMIALAIGLCLASCGGGKQKNAEQKIEEAIRESAEQTEVTENNWQSQIKKQFAVDIPVPDGWTFNSVRSYPSMGIVIVAFTQTDDNAVSGLDALKTVFDATKAASSEGCYLINTDSETMSVFIDKKYETVDDVCKPEHTFGGTFIGTFWYYTLDGKSKVANFDYDKDKKSMSVKFEHSKLREHIK